MLVEPSDITLEFQLHVDQFYMFINLNFLWSQAHNLNSLNLTLSSVLFSPK